MIIDFLPLYHSRDACDYKRIATMFLLNPGHLLWKLVGVGTKLCLLLDSLASKL